MREWASFREMLTNGEPKEPQPHVPPDEPEDTLSDQERCRKSVEYMRAKLLGLDSVGTSAQASTNLKSQSVTSSNPKDLAATVGGKCRLQLIPPIAERHIADVLGNGADKYGPWNWRDERISLMNYLGAMRRHINQILGGEDIDQESGLPHLAHVAATAAIVMDAVEHNCVIDDRPGEAGGE